MIDTIVLTLTQDMYQITQLDAFTPSAGWILKHSSAHYSGIQSKQNPTKKELLRGIYKPRLALAQYPTSRTTFEPMLKIELSLPKLVYGNNFDELSYKDFKQVTEKLVAVLATMGIVVARDTLAKASVAAIHYSKNIPLTDGSTPYHYINKMKEANVKLSLDTNQTDYRNEGHSYKWHCNSYEIAFYDKIKDLEKSQQSSRRAIEKDNELQRHLVKSFEMRHKLEFLRMEVRLNKRAKIKELFKELGIAARLTFKRLFKPAIAKRVLLHYLDKLESKRLALLDYTPKSDKALLVGLIMNNPTASANKIIQLFGLKKALAIVTPRELRSLLAQHNQRSWYRLIADAQSINLPPVNSPFDVIRKQLVSFKALRFDNCYRKRRRK